MESLASRHGHQGLRASFEPYIALAALNSESLSNIAQHLGLTRQAVNQTVNEIERLGYVTRVEDPADRRAKILQITTKGKTLISKGALISEQIESEFASIVGSDNYRQANLTLLTLSRAIDLVEYYPIDDNAEARLSGLLPRLSNYVKDRLRMMITEKGHHGMKPGHGMLLLSLTPEGSRVQPIVRRFGVSKQTISTLASGLEDLGYIEKKPDPDDPRQLLLSLSERGKQLMHDSIDASTALEKEFAAIVGATAFDNVKAMLLALVASLNNHGSNSHRTNTLTSRGIEISNDRELKELAISLCQQLGKQRSTKLAQLILAWQI